MKLLPSYPRYCDTPRPGILFKISGDVYVKPVRRVKCLVRVIVARRTPESCSGSHYCGLDVFVAHGISVTPYFHVEKFSRFADSFITDDSILRSRANEMHQREAYLPNALSDVEFNNTTHIHVVTGHLDHFNIPKRGELLNLDLCFVEIVEKCEIEITTLARGNTVFGTFKCPFVIPTDQLRGLETLRV